MSINEHYDNTKLSATLLGVGLPLLGAGAGGAAYYYLLEAGHKATLAFGAGFGIFLGLVALSIVSIILMRLHARKINIVRSEVKALEGSVKQERSIKLDFTNAKLANAELAANFFLEPSDFTDTLQAVAARKDLEQVDIIPPRDESLIAEPANETALQQITAQRMTIRDELIGTMARWSERSTIVNPPLTINFIYTTQAQSLQIVPTLRQNLQLRELSIESTYETFNDDGLVGCLKDMEQLHSLSMCAYSGRLSLTTLIALVRSDRYAKLNSCLITNLSREDAVAWGWDGRGFMLNKADSSLGISAQAIADWDDAYDGDVNAGLIELWQAAGGFSTLMVAFDLQAPETLEPFIQFIYKLASSERNSESAILQKLQIKVFNGNFQADVPVATMQKFHQLIASTKPLSTFHSINIELCDYTTGFVDHILAPEFFNFLAAGLDSLAISTQVHFCDMIHTDVQIRQWRVPGLLELDVSAIRLDNKKPSIQAQLFNFMGQHPNLITLKIGILYADSRSLLKLAAAKIADADLSLCEFQLLDRGQPLKPAAYNSTAAFDQATPLQRVNTALDEHRQQVPARYVDYPQRLQPAMADRIADLPIAREDLRLMSFARLFSALFPVVFGEAGFIARMNAKHRDKSPKKDLHAIPELLSKNIWLKIFGDYVYPQADMPSISRAYDMVRAGKFRDQPDDGEQHWAGAGRYYSTSTLKG